MIPAYSPQARGRSERAFRTWQGRLPQELRIRNIKTLEEANRFLEKEYIKEFNSRFAVEAKEEGSAFTPYFGDGLDRIFSIQSERAVNRDNTVRFKNLVLQIEKQSWRASLDGSKVIVYEHLDETITIGIGPHEVGRFTKDGEPLKNARKTMAATVSKKVNSPSYQNQQTGHVMC